MRRLQRLPKSLAIAMLLLDRFSNIDIFDAKHACFMIDTHIKRPICTQACSNLGQLRIFSPQ